LGFTYSSTSEQIQKFCQQLRYFIKQEPFVDQDRIAVHFSEFAESSINVLVSFHYKVDDANLELVTNESYLYQIQKIANDLKLSFAFPTRPII
jgi:MscS family membrane protein